MLSRQITLADINDTILFKLERRADLNMTLTSNIAYDISSRLDHTRAPQATVHYFPAKPLN